MQMLTQTPTGTGMDLPKNLIRILALLRTTPTEHRWYPGDPEIVFLSSSMLQSMFGKRYTEYRDRCFELVCGDWSKAKGITKAWRMKPDVAAYIDSILEDDKAIREVLKTSPTETTYTEVFRMDILKAFCDGSRPTNNPEDLRSCRLYLASATQVSDTIGVTYVEYRRAYQTGRRFAFSPSLQGLPKYVRGALLQGLPVSDIDMENAHPNILMQTLEKMGFSASDFPLLSDYTEDRDIFLHDLQDRYGMDRPTAKALFLMLIYGASLNGPTVKEEILANLNPHVAYAIQETGWPMYLLDFQSELNKASRVICAAHQSILKDSQGYRPRALALVMQGIEDQILAACEDYYRNRQGFRVQTLCFDGFILEHSTEPDLKDLSSYVAEKTGYRMVFTVKPFTTNIC